MVVFNGHCSCDVLAIGSEICVLMHYREQIGTMVDADAHTYLC